MRIFRMMCVVCLVWFALAGVAGAQTLRCSSDDGHRRFCDADTRNGVTLTNQMSSAACQQGYSWGYDEHGIWVDHGCRAEFALQRIEGTIFYCASDDGRRNYCNVEARGHVALIKQRSDAACREGYSWGFDERGVWVDHGCRADFAVERRERPEHDEAPRAPVQSLYCASDDGRKNFCQVDARGGVEMVKQRSGSACQQGYSWGFDERGIWVDHGCRADFVATGRSEERGEEHRDERSCRRSLGDERAEELVRKCIQVSPGTHPPCNAENSCRMITEEIRRGCMLLGGDAPRYCDEYR